jgi:hypothetical protein
MQLVAKLAVLFGVAAGILAGMYVPAVKAGSVRLLTPTEAGQLYGGVAQLKDKDCETQAKCADQLKKGCSDYATEEECKDQFEDIRTAAGYACTAVNKGKLCTEEQTQKICLNKYACRWNTDLMMCEQGALQPDPPMGNQGCASVDDPNP